MKIINLFKPRKTQSEKIDQSILAAKKRIHAIGLSVNEFLVIAEKFGFLNNGKHNLVSLLIELEYEYQLISKIDQNGVENV